jgi:Transposase DDE domain
VGLPLFLVTRKTSVSSYRFASAPPSFSTVLDTCAQSADLPFRDVLTEAPIQTLAEEEGVSFGEGAGCVYSVAVTLWAFLAQMLSKEKSCVAAVARVVVLLAALGREPCAAGAGAYCKARAKLPERFLQRLVYDVGQRLEDEAPLAWRWQGRRTILADGTTVLLADTPANQAAYPQMKSQKPGVGFPILRLVVLLGLATAGVLGVAMGPYTGKETGESALLRTLFDQLRRGDVLVADRYYCSYWIVALVQALGVDVVFRLHHLRHYDFRRGQRLGRGDRVVTWTKPAKPKWMDADAYAAVPATLTMRELRVTRKQPGYRVEEPIVATTLVDGARYPKDAIADLYKDRWHVELDLRSIKSFLGMEMLRCQKPEMARKELWMHLLAYNPIRKVQAQAALPQGIGPRQLSFAGTMQALQVFRWVLLLAHEQRPMLLGCLLNVVAQHRVGNRPGRSEPRKVKRRWKTYGLLHKPRAEERAESLG